jgi:hypothetical protein
VGPPGGGKKIVADDVPKASEVFVFAFHPALLPELVPGVAPKWLPTHAGLTVRDSKRW